MLRWFGHWGLSIRSVLLVCVALGVALAACSHARPLTAADMDRLGTRSYGGSTPRGQAFRAAVAALKSLGYETASVNESAGRIQSAPKPLADAAGAPASGGTLAWDIQVSEDSEGTVIHARAQRYHDGKGVPPSELNAAPMKRMYDALFGAINDNLPAVTTRTSRAATGGAR